jgi:cytochrome b561
MGGARDARGAYCLLFAVPLLGWANASARGFAVAAFLFIPLPALMPQGSPAGLALGDIHTFAAYALLALFGLHVLASLYHHVWLRDRVLSRILPLASRER